MNMQTFSKVPGQVGYLLLHESGATISSSGELENDEKTAEIIFNLISVTDKLDPLAFPNEGFNKISRLQNYRRAFSLLFYIVPEFAVVKSTARFLQAKYLIGIAHMMKKKSEWI